MAHRNAQNLPMAQMFCPLLKWHPWEPLRFTQGRYRWLWRDLYGRPRSLKPWEMNEPLWRSEALQLVTLPSLAASIAD